ncbi:unnamed protein product [Paramecium octaurelia]|uniref:Uncharacterized protein n=1 Tax=Paramecium octaurelia TaxID=43137 RepID=A0A8S1YCG2_PAROT|nr:unnamed protein product [Paramecium octaurelia]
MNSILYIYIDSQPLESQMIFYTNYHISYHQPSSLSNIQNNNSHYSLGKMFQQKET